MVNTKALILSIILVVYLYILFRYPKSTYLGPSYPFTAETTDFNTLKKVCIEKVKYIKSESGIFTPYNKPLMDRVEKVINNATTLRELAISSLLMPNNGLGLAQIDPLNKAIDSTLFQFEQGNVGWYWGYSTYTDPISNVMYYIIRIDLGTPSIREKFNLPLGSTTIYSVSFGIGVKGVWNYTPYIICGGKYEMFEKTKFRFTASFSKGINGADGYVLFQSIKDGEFNLDVGWNDQNRKKDIIDKKYDYQTLTTYSLNSPNSPSLNSINGCFPCFSGIGTLYWSYTQLNTSSYINTPQGIVNVSNGDGWLDHQWYRGSEIKQPFYRMIANIFSNKKTGLGRYMWINLHTTKNNMPYQYMISVYPDENIDIKEGLKLDTVYNIYSRYIKNNILSKKGSVKILKTVIISNITYPTIIEVNVEDIDGIQHIYTLDSTPYGNCYTIDLTGNYHWSGSTALYEDNKIAGTGFLESNQFQTPLLYRKTTMTLGNFPEDSVKVYDGSPYTLTQNIPSIIALIIPIILFFYIIIIIFRNRSSIKQL